MRRRFFGVTLVAALASALLLQPAFAFSAPLLPAPASDLDLRAPLLIRLFGETSDFGASVAAAYGDRASESPLRDLALGAQRQPGSSAFAADVASVPTFAQERARARGDANLSDLARMIGSNVLETTARLAAPPVQASPVSVDPITASPSAPFTTAAYQPVEPSPDVSPEPGALAFGPLVRPPELSALSYAGSLPGALRSSVSAPSAMQVGPVAFQGRVEGVTTQSPAISLHDNAYGAGANFDVRAGRRNLNVDVSSSYEHLARNDVNTFSSSTLGSTSSWELPGSDAPLVIPNYADLNKLTVGAAVAVPVMNGLTLNLNYDMQRLIGGYGLPGLTNLDATDNSYGGRLTFEIPHSSSTLSVSARQYRYQDNILPANTFTQTREDVNFTVKF